MRKLLKYLAILLVGTLLPTNKVYPQWNDEEWGVDITKIESVTTYVGWLEKEFPIYQCHYKWLEDSLNLYVHQYKQRYPYLEEEFGRCDTFMLKIKAAQSYKHRSLLPITADDEFSVYDNKKWETSEIEDKSHKYFHHFFLSMKVDKEFRAYDNNNWQKSEMDEVVGCLQTDSCFFMLVGTPPATYFQKTDNNYTHTYLIRNEWWFGIDQLSVWCIYLYRDPKKHVMVKDYCYDVLFNH